MNIAVDHLMQIDFELINAALDLELNVEMAPDRVRRAVETRLRQLEKRERQRIPQFVWNLLEHIIPDDVSGLHRLNPNLPEPGRENYEEWFIVSKDSSSPIVSVLPRKQPPAEFLAALRGKPRFKHWEGIFRPRVHVGPKVLTMECDIFQDLPNAFVKRVLVDF